MPAIAGPRPGEARSQELSAGVPHGWQGPVAWSHHGLPPRHSSLSASHLSRPLTQSLPDSTILGFMGWQSNFKEMFNSSTILVIFLTTRFKTLTVLITIWFPSLHDSFVMV